MYRTSVQFNLLKQQLTRAVPNIMFSEYEFVSVDYLIKSAISLAPIIFFSF